MDDGSTYYGLQVLVEVNEPTVDIIAVQGLASDPEKSWIWKAQSKEDKRKEINWLKEPLPKDVPNARIMAFNYESRWLKGASYQYIGNCAELLLAALHAPNLEDKPNDRPIIFIGHSFGGIVIQRAIVEAILNFELSYLLDRIVGILFLGTPNRGTNFATYARYIAYIGKHLKFGSHDNGYWNTI